MQETQGMWVWSMGRKIPWSRKWLRTPVLLPRIPWTEEPGGLQCMESPRVRHNWTTEHTHTHTHTLRTHVKMIIAMLTGVSGSWRSKGCPSLERQTSESRLDNTMEYWKWYFGCKNNSRDKPYNYKEREEKKLKKKIMRSLVEFHGHQLFKCTQ